MRLRTYIIWKREKHARIEGYREVAGVVTATYDVADAVVDRLNAADDTTKCHREGNYYKAEVNQLTVADCLETSHV